MKSIDRKLLRDDHACRTHRQASLDSYQFPLQSPVTHALPGRGEHIDLAAHAELRQIDPRLDREAGVGQQAALVVRLQVVQIAPEP